ADDDAPRAAREIMELEDREAPERDAEPEDVAHEPRAEERSGIEPRPRDRRRERKGTDDERTPPGAGEPRVARERGHGAPPAASRPARASAGTSARSACWLRCRARTYAAIAQRSARATWLAYAGIAPQPRVLTSTN